MAGGWMGQATAILLGTFMPHYRLGIYTGVMLALICRAHTED